MNEARLTDRFSFGTLDGDSPMLRERELSRVMKRRSANINLHKSLQLLDEAIVPPMSHSNSSHKLSADLRHSTYTPQHVATDNKFDTAKTFGISTPSAKAAAIERKPVSLEGVIMTDDEKDVIECNGLFADFMEVLKQNHPQNQFSQIISRYEQFCAENLQLLDRIAKNTVPGQHQFIRCVNMINSLKQERNTWKLINSIYKERIGSDMKADEEPMLVDSLGKCLSEKQIVDRLYERDAVVRQAQIITDWLESNASDELEDYYYKHEFFVEPKGSQENTRHLLKQVLLGNNIKTDRPLVNQLDPDASTRQKRPMMDLDIEDEHRLLKYTFALIRAGHLDQAQKLCSQFGEPWRAATLEGWRLCHDPNYGGCYQNDKSHKIQGNFYRDVWKSVCWRMADDNNVTVHERAIYAAFCGNLPQLLQACDTWEDYLWSYLRVMIDQRVENELRLTFTSHKPTKPLPTAYWEKQVSYDNVFQDIQACHSERVRQEAQDKYRILQKYIILGDIDSMIEEIYEWIKEDSPSLSSHMVRFFAHVILFLRSIGMCTKEELCVAILEAYVKVLIVDKQNELIATYVSHLPRDSQVEWYARYLADVLEPETRQQCLHIAKNCGLDVASITKLVVEKVRSREPEATHVEGDLPSEACTTDEDSLKINALEWLIFDPVQRGEAMRQANALMRTFLSFRKIAAAKQTFHKLPSDSIDLIIKQWQLQTGETELCAADANAIREYLCAQTYIIAHDSFNDWFEHFHNAKPIKPDLHTSTSFTEKVAFDHKERQYEVEMDRWKHSLALQTNATVEKIYNVLLFVDGGWMIDQRTDGYRDENRIHQMRLLRQLCLPTMCFLLHTVLHTTQQYRRCLQIADVISSEQHQIYKTFRKDEHRKILMKFQESSVALLDSSFDPIGYE